MNFLFTPSHALRFANPFINAMKIALNKAGATVKLVAQKRGVLKDGIYVTADGQLAGTFVSLLIGAIISSVLGHVGATNTRRRYATVVDRNYS